MIHRIAFRTRDVRRKAWAIRRIAAAKPSDFTRINVDTTVQPKAVMFPTDARLMHRARERLIRLAKRHGVKLRQTYSRVKDTR